MRAYRVALADHVAQGAVGLAFVVTVVVEVDLVRTPALEPELGSHERGTQPLAVLLAHL